MADPVEEDLLPLYRYKKAHSQPFKSYTLDLYSSDVSVPQASFAASIHSLAQQDSILQTLHEAVADPFARHILNPQPQLLFLLGVVLPCKLREGWNRGQRSNTGLGFFNIQFCSKTAADLRPSKSQCPSPISRGMPRVLLLNFIKSTKKEAGLVQSSEDRGNISCGIKKWKTDEQKRMHDLPLAPSRLFKFSIFRITLFHRCVISA